MDISSAPILADITVDGKPVKAVAQPSKQGFLYVFDRVTGKPVWQSKREGGTRNRPDEWYSPTQRSTKLQLTAQRRIGERPD